MVAQNLGMKTVISAQLSVRFEKLRTIVRMLKKNDNRAFSESVTNSEANIIATRISLDVGFRELKNAL